jgi:hypothetical protein
MSPVELGTKNHCAGEGQQLSEPILTWTLWQRGYTYEGESVNRSQMDMKRKTCDVIFEPGKYNYLFIYPLPTSIHLYHHFISASKPAAYKSFDCRLSHFRNSASTSSSSAKRLPPNCEPLYTTNTSHRKHETFLYEYPSHWVLLPIKKSTTEHCFSVVHTSSTVANLTTETILWKCTCASTTVTKLNPAAAT